MLGAVARGRQRVDSRDLDRPSRRAKVRDGRERAGLGRTVSDPGATRAQARSSVRLNATAGLGQF